jgi:hypothetical protein
MLARVRTPSHRSEREREKKKREGDRVIKMERERERCRICPEFLSLFLKGTISCLVN